MALDVLDAGATVAVVITRAAIDHVAPGEYVPTADRRVVMYGVDWTAFESFLALRGDGLPRVAYLEGTLELTSPSKDHEILKKYFAAVVEAYLDQAGVDYQGVGSWLLEHAPRKAGLVPDECYILRAADKPRPDLAFEVVWNKLEIYERLGVGEVWFWIDNEITVHVLSPKWLRATRTQRVPTRFRFLTRSANARAADTVRGSQAHPRPLRGEATVMACQSALLELRTRTASSPTARLAGAPRGGHDVEQQAEGA